MTDKQFEQIEYLSKKLWGDINNGHEYSMVTYTEFLGIVTEVWEGLQEGPVSEELEDAVNAYIGHAPDIDECSSVYGKRQAFKAGAKWQETKDESTTEDLGEYINELSKQFPEVSFAKLSRIAVRVAKWQKENLWKPADGDDLPEIDKEVIVLIQPYPLENSEYAVSFAHRPNPDGWDGKSVTTGKVEHYTPKTYDKGGWNIPNVKYWLDAEFPKEIEL